MSPDELLEIIDKKNQLMLPSDHYKQPIAKLYEDEVSEFMGKTFQAAQLTHERFLTIDHSYKIFFLISAKLNFHQPLACSTIHNIEVRGSSVWQISKEKLQE